MEQLENKFNELFRIFHRNQSTFDEARKFSEGVLEVLQAMKTSSGRIGFPSVEGLECTWWGNVEPGREGIEGILKASGISLREVSELLKLARNRVIGASFYKNPTIFVLSHEVLYWTSTSENPQDYELHLLSVGASLVVDIRFSFVPVEDF